MNTRTSAWLTLGLVALLGAAGAGVPTGASGSGAAVVGMAGAAALGHGRRVLLGAAAAEISGDAVSEIVPVRTPHATRQERRDDDGFRAQAGARPALALQTAFAALGRDSHPSTAPPGSF